VPAADAQGLRTPVPTHYMKYVGKPLLTLPVPAADAQGLGQSMPSRSLSQPNLQVHAPAVHTCACCKQLLLGVSDSTGLLTLLVPAADAQGLHTVQLVICPHTKRSKPAGSVPAAAAHLACACC
jgi:hypothetical protein